MAPIGMVGPLGWLSSPEVGIISLVVFLILNITLLALCMRCNRKTINTYDLNAGATADGGRPTKTKSGVAASPGDTSWRNHQHMPQYTLERSNTQTS